MNRDNLRKSFEKIGARVTIRKGSSLARDGVIRMNVTNDKQGEHFTMTIHPDINESEITLQVLDFDPKLRQMLIFIRAPRIDSSWVGGRQIFKRGKPNETFDERLLLGRDEMHWFVAGVTMAKNIREAFALLRPKAVNISMIRQGVKTKEWKKRKTKGFIRQGEWFFVPVNFQEDKSTIIHKNEPISRRGGTSHVVEEVVRFGGETVYVKRDRIITESEYKSLSPEERLGFSQQVRGATVLGRGKVKHPDHHTINLPSWHEIHISTEVGNSTNAFID